MAVGTKWKWVEHCLGSLVPAAALNDALHANVGLGMDVTQKNKNKNLNVIDNKNLRTKV